MNILNRGNDLNEFFLPILYFIKNQISIDNGIPLWNTLFFSGTPLLPDPQNLFIYPLNILFLYFDINLGILVSTVLHMLIGVIGFYLLTKSILSNTKFSNIVSLIFGILYSLSPKFFGYLEAGHFGLIQSWAFIPWVYLAIVKITNNGSYLWTILLSMFLYFTYSSHILVFLILEITAFLLIFYINPKQIKLFLISNFILAILIFPILIPQLKWQNQTTRDFLLTTPETYPVWNRKLEFVKNIFVATNDTEKNITIGIVVTYLAIWGFMKLDNKSKFFISILLIIASILSFNILTFDWFLKFRVSTRFWFPAIIVTLLTGARGLQYLAQKNKIYLIFGIVGILEYLAVAKFILDKPIKPIPPTPNEVIKFLTQDKQIYRVFCLNKCIRQIDSAIYNIELVEGYGTLQQKNYFEYSQQLAQGYWEKKYTLSIPPYQNYLYEKLKPFPPALSAYRVKYVISPYELNINHLLFIKNVDSYNIYQNILYKKPNYEIYKPNFIRVKIEGEENTLTIPEVYNPDWNAYLDGLYKVEVFESPDKTRSVNIHKNIKFVDFKYEPFKLF